MRGSFEGPALAQQDSQSRLLPQDARIRGREWIPNHAHREQWQLLTSEMPDWPLAVVKVCVSRVS